MNYRTLFYWITVADNAKIFFGVFAVLFVLIGGVSMLITLNAFDSSDIGRARARKWVFWSWPFMLIFISLWVLTPDRKDAFLIVAGGGAMNYLSNDSTAKAIPHEFLDWVSVELKSMAADAKVDLGIKTTKERVLEESKNMSVNQLMERMNVDTAFARIILDSRK